MLLDVRESLVYAIQGSFLLGAVLMAIACVVNFFLKEVPLRKTNAAPDTQAAPTAQGGEAVAVSKLAMQDGD